MFNTFFTQTAQSTPVLGNRGMGAKNVQEALERLAFLAYASSLNGVIHSHDGSVTIKLGIVDTSLVLPSSDARWKVSVNDSGEITADKLDESDQSVITYWRFKREDGSSVAVEITDDGEVIMVNPPDYVGLHIKNFYLRSPSNNLFLLNVNTDDEFYTEPAVKLPNPKFRVISQDEQVLFSTVEHRDLALNYMPIYTVQNLPARPLNLTGVVPMAFVRLGQSQRPVYHDGTTWKYLNTDTPVIEATSDTATDAQSQTQPLLIPSPVGYWQLSINDSGQISTTLNTSINTSSPLPAPVLVASPVGIWYVSASETGSLLTQLISGVQQPSQIKVSSENNTWELLASSSGELFLQKTDG